MWREQRNEGVGVGWGREAAVGLASSFGFLPSLLTRASNPEHPQFLQVETTPGYAARKISAIHTRAWKSQARLAAEHGIPRLFRARYVDALVRSNECYRSTYAVDHCASSFARVILMDYTHSLVIIRSVRNGPRTQHFRPMLTCRRSPIDDEQQCIEDMSGF